MFLDPTSKSWRETDPLVLSRRQKQIDYGKNTNGYKLYLENVPRHKRSKQHPETPPKNMKFTRREWDGLVKKWRIRLHYWDPYIKNEFDDEFTTSTSSELCLPPSMTSWDSNSQASDSRPSTLPPTTGSSENSSQVKREFESVSSADQVQFKKIKIEYS